jgi:hypothetical protein
MSLLIPFRGLKPAGYKVRVNNSNALFCKSHQSENNRVKINSSSNLTISYIAVTSCVRTYTHTDISITMSSAVAFL